MNEGYRDGDFACNVQQEGPEIYLRARFTENIAGRRYHVEIDRALRTTPRTTINYSQSLVVELNQSLLFSYQSSMQLGSPVNVSVEWGKFVDGIDDGEFQISNGSVTGMLNGKAIKKYTFSKNNPDARFENGTLVPTPKVSPEVLLNSLQELQLILSSLLANCSPEHSSVPTLFPLQLPAQEFGHFSLTYDTSSCNSCKTQVVIEDIITQLVVCILGTFWGCLVHLVIHIVDVVEGIHDCSKGPNCCPVGCEPDSGFFATPACCFAGEVCMNGDGRCCPTGSQVCAGKTCCTPDETCITSGPLSGFCCPDSLSCGPSCCDEGQICQIRGLGQCCSPELLCGDAACCDMPGGLPTTGSYCADSLIGLCCDVAPFEVSCNGVCCPADACCSGTCCSSDLICQNNMCVKPTQGTAEWCAKHGGLFTGKLCNVAADCHPGSFCEVGCCVYPPPK